MKGLPHLGMGERTKQAAGHSQLPLDDAETRVTIRRTVSAEAIPLGEALSAGVRGELEGAVDLGRVECLHPHRVSTLKSPFDSTGPPTRPEGP